MQKSSITLNQDFKKYIYIIWILELIDYGTKYCFKSTTYSMRDASLNYCWNILGELKSVAQSKKLRLSNHGSIIVLECKNILGEFYAIGHKNNYHKIKYEKYKRYRLLAVEMFKLH